MSRGDRGSPPLNPVDSVNAIGTQRGDRSNASSAVATGIDIKDVPNTEATNFAEAVRQAISVLLGFRGDKLAKAVTIGDLVDAGIVTFDNGVMKKVP